MYAWINSKSKLLFLVCKIKWNCKIPFLKWEISKQSCVNSWKLMWEKICRIIMIKVRVASYAVSSESITIMVFSTPGLK